ncbi:MAG: ATP-binding protein [Treponema sp.]|nr:ATP-binding protein [Treponema sp.]
MKSGKKNSVLIVDDERDNISALKAILSPDYTVYASTNGKDAIETVLEFMPDVILLDVLMPDMDGYDVITSFKNSEKMRDIPVIFITGLDNINAEIKGLALGASDYISKPFHPAIVLLRVQHQMQLVERLRQQALMTKISHNFLVNANTDSLYTDTLRMIGEFMDIATVLLYKLDISNNIITCQNEWLNPQLNLQTRIGDKIELNEKLLSIVKNLLQNNENDLFSHSSNVIFKEYVKTKRQYLENYIVTPIFVKGNMSALLIFSKEENAKWNESETGLAVLVASIFSGIFERDAIQHAEYLSRVKSEFLSRMSHEMRTPLNAIIGILQIFDLLGVPDNIKEHCVVMNASANKLLVLIDDVLEISDIEYGAFKLAETVFDLKKMLWDLLRETDENAIKKRQLLECKVDSNIPDLLKGDERRLKQVITTLLDNASKFTEEDGEINFDASVINSDDETVTIQIGVTDNGIGISEEQQKNIFSVFEQADNGENRVYGGAGLGLAIAKRIVEMMKGKIWVESELGKGSKFHFTCMLKK